MPFNLGFEFNPSSDSTTTGNNGGEQGSWFPGGAIFVAGPVSESVSLGFSLTSPGGLLLDPDDAWQGRNWVTETALLNLTFEPSVGVRLNDEWSVGAGIDLQYVKFKQDLVGPAAGLPISLDGDDWNVGFSLSTLWEQSETTRYGLRYRSQISHDLGGDFSLVGSQPVSTSFTMPASLTFSPYHEISETVALMADLGWTDWSAFDRNVITFDAGGAAVELPRNFKDTWTFGLGTHIKTSEKWLFMFGGSYVTSAVDDADRTPDLPVDEQVRLATGFEYAASDRWTLGANYTYLWLGNNDINQSIPTVGTIDGDYDTSAHIFGLYASMSF